MERSVLTTTEKRGTTEFVNVISVPFDQAYAAPVAKSVTVNTGPIIRGKILYRGKHPLLDRTVRNMIATYTSFQPKHIWQP